MEQQTETPEQTKKRKRTLLLVGIVGLAVILIVWLLTISFAKADCISSNTYALINTMKNATNNTVDLTPLISDMQNLCYNVSNITANLNTNYTMLVTTNQTLYYFMRNVTNVGNISNFTIGNYTYYLITPYMQDNITNFDLRLDDVESKTNNWNSQMTSLNGIVTNMQNTVNSINSNYATKSYVDDRDLANNMSVNTTIQSALDQKQDKNTNTYIWVGLFVVLMISVGLFFFGRR